MKKSDQQKAKIIKIARELFSEKGFEATTTRQINHQAQIADGLLYYYFPHGKKELLDTIVRQGLQERINIFGNSLAPKLTRANIADQLIALFDQMWASFDDEANYQSFMITVRERMLLSDDQATWVRKQTVSIQTSLTAALVDAPAFMNVTTDEINSFAVIVVSIFQKTIYDELLIHGHRHLLPAVRGQIIDQIQLLLKLALKNDEVR